jgi:molybdopterin/thiamine biosynthesis adenylyltransferase
MGVIMIYNSQLKLMNPKNFGNKSISLVGVGATGSNIALTLAQLGWGDSNNGQGILKLFDGDIVEEHNLANQCFYPHDIGKPKVEAMNDIIKRKCNFSVQTFNKMVVTEDKDVQSTYVFLLTDTMKSRKEIFENCLKYSFNTDMVIETRMGLRGGRIYAFNPHISEEVEAWKKTLCTDEEADVSLCGTSQSIVVTAIYIASIACSKMIQHFNQKYCNQPEVKIWNEFIFTLYPESFFLRMFMGNETLLIA